MIWPPVKAWTSKKIINGHRHFVAINYGGNLLDRWALLISVIDSNILVKVSWIQLMDPSIWESGWDEKNNLDFSEIVNNISKIDNTICNYPSIDSGLTIPITKKKIRAWFCNN